MEPADVSVATVAHRAMLDDDARLAAAIARATHQHRLGGPFAGVHHPSFGVFAETCLEEVA